MATDIFSRLEDLDELNGLKGVVIIANQWQNDNKAEAKLGLRRG
jgi:hypothetical protein